MDHAHYIYILACTNGVALYVGETHDLPGRIWQHKNEVVPSHTKKYHIHKLVYYEVHENASAAKWREKQLKRWRRDWKNELITKFNPRWDDLYLSVCK